jgi:hypothetical protein
MSTDPRAPDRAEPVRTEPERDRADARREKKPKQPPLSQREVFDLLLRDPVVRPYLYAALGALALVFLVMFDNGSDIGAVLVALLGIANLLFRWVSGPPFLLFVIAYFAVFPFGFPEAEFADPRKIPDNYFRIADLVLVLASLVYTRCAYRLFGLIHVAMPLENAYPRAEDAPPRRPPAHVAPTELVWMIGTALALLGQGAWWAVNNVEFFPASGAFPFRWADDDPRRFMRRGPLEAGEFTAGQTRFFVSLFVLFFGYLLLRLVFGYWRLRTMSAAEAASVCTDTAWAETHRERVRLEKWRLWRIQQALERERAAKRAEREAKKREEAEARAEERRKARAAWEASEAERRRERAEERRRRRDDDDDDDRPRRRRRRDEDDDDDDRPRRRR